MRQLATDENFWNNNKAASTQLKKISLLEKEINMWSKIDSSLNDFNILVDFYESGDIEFDEIYSELVKFVDQV